MPKKATIPTAVLVARWSALAASAAAIGSFLNTMWTSKPWWVEMANKPAPIVEPARSGGDGTEMLMMVQGAAPDPTFYQKIQEYVYFHTTSVGVIVLCGLVVVVASVMEYRHRHRHKSDINEVNARR